MRILKAKEKKERALGVRLGLKAYRSDSPKSAMVRRPTRPGIHGGKRARKPSEYKLQLMEKQKIKFSYGLTERQMKRIVRDALQSKESTPSEIVRQLEVRLDNAVFRLGLAPSRIVARQLVGHGHISVNGRKVTIPSYRVKTGEVITIKEKSKNMLFFKDLANILKSKQLPDWLSVDSQTLTGEVKGEPHDVDVPIDINLVIDYYSR
jgi:small subunit ribosomal protein S4